MPEVRDLTAALRDVQLELVDTRKATTRRTAWMAVAVFVAGAVGLVGVVVGKTAGDALDEFKAQRAEARVVACTTDNTTAEQINGLNERTQDLLRTLAAPTAPPRSPEAQARVDALLEDQLARFDEVRVPLRDCTPDGIAEFYETDQTNGG